MPRPTDIMPSGTVNSGACAPGSVHPENATPRVRVRLFAWIAIRSTSSRSAPSSAAAPAMRNTHRSPAMPRRARERVRRRAGDVVGHQDRAHIHSRLAQLALGGAEVDDIARVVAVAEQDAAAGVDLARDAHGLTGRRRREDVAAHGSGGKPRTDQSRERRIVTGAAPDDDGDPPVGERPGAHDPAVDATHQVLMGAREALEGVVDEGLRVAEHAGHRAASTTCGNCCRTRLGAGT